MIFGVFWDFCKLLSLMFVIFHKVHEIFPSDMPLAQRYLSKRILHENCRKKIVEIVASSFVLCIMTLLQSTAKYRLQGVETEFINIRFL